MKEIIAATIVAATLLLCANTNAEPVTRTYYLELTTDAYGSTHSVNPPEIMEHGGCMKRAEAVLKRSNHEPFTPGSVTASCIRYSLGAEIMEVGK